MSPRDEGDPNQTLRLLQDLLTVLGAGHFMNGDLDHFRDPLLYALFAQRRSDLIFSLMRNWNAKKSLKISGYNLGAQRPDFCVLACVISVSIVQRQCHSLYRTIHKQRPFALNGLQSIFNHQTKTLKRH